MQAPLFPLFEQYPNLFTAFSTKDDGPMKIDNPQAAPEGLKNREKFLEKYNISLNKVVSVDLVHGNTVAIVGSKNAGETIPQTDGLITNEIDLYLALTVADCLPVFFYDSQQQVIGLVHAGWRGLENGILKNAATALKQLNCSLENVLVGIGPGIEPCHFEIQKDLVEKFASYPEALIKREGKYFLDLKKIAQTQLLQSGFTQNHIDTNPLCTYDEANTYFSHRRDKISPIQAMLAVIGMK